MRNLSSYSYFQNYKIIGGPKLDMTTKYSKVPEL